MSAASIEIASGYLALLLAITLGFSVELAPAGPKPRRQRYSPSHAALPPPVPGAGVISSARAAFRRWRTRPERLAHTGDRDCPGCKFIPSGPCRCAADCGHPDCEGGAR